MENFGLKSKKVYGCFQLKYLTLLMMLIPCSCTRDNIPSFNVTCGFTGLYVKIAFSKPFSGIVYAKGYRFNPLCSMTESSALNVSLTLPLSACGTYVQETNHPWITNTVVIQQHPLIRTADDIEKSLTCSLPSFESFWDPPLSLDQVYESHFLPLTESPLDIEFGSYVFHEDSAKIFTTRLTIFQLRNGTIYNDVGIKSCIAHNEGILDGNSSVHEISNPEGCFSANSEDSSNLTIIETDEGLMAYVDIDNLGIVSSDNIYLTCEVVFCKTKCICSEIHQQTEHQTSVISHKLTKRSTDTSSEMFSLKQYEARTRYLKSTVRALMNNIMEQRKQNDKKSKIRKRLMRLDDSSFLSEKNSLGSGLAPTEIFFPEPVSTDIYNMEPQLIDVDYDSDPEVSDHEYDSDPENSDHEYDSDPENSDHEYDSDPEVSRHDYWEEPSLKTELSTVDSDMVVAASPNEFKDNGTKTIPDEELQARGTTVLTVDLVSSVVNETTENTKTLSPTISSFPSAVDVGDHLDSCVPRLRFIIVIVVMGFFIGCLLMVSCGMALYIRKEKKRSKLNDFLLYSISF